jgi:hypothetical protein
MGCSGELCNAMMVTLLELRTWLLCIYHDKLLRSELGWMIRAHRRLTLKMPRGLGVADNSQNDNLAGALASQSEGDGHVIAYASRPAAAAVSYRIPHNS